MMTFMVAFSSSVFSAILIEVEREFSVSQTVATLGISAALWGSATAPVLWGPSSKVYGIPIFVGFTGFVLFHIPVAVARNLETVIVCQFLVVFLGRRC